MGNNVVELKSNLPKFNDQHEQFLTVRLNGQLFGISVLRVRDVLKPLPITRIPLATPQIKGYMNLRGRIVTVIDVRMRLGIPSLEENLKRMYVVVEHDDELYSLLVDEVGEARMMANKSFEKNPVNLSESWRSASKGVFKMEDELMLVLDIDYLLNL